MEQNLHLSDFIDTILSDLAPYHRLMGCLIYLTVTRPNIVHTINILRQKKQTPISRSSVETEYRTMAVATCEITWLSFLLQDIGLPLPKCVSLHYDNQVALHIAANPVYHERTKHIEIDCHVVREKIQQGLLCTKKIASANQIADSFTKSHRHSGPSIGKGSRRNGTFSVQG
ncbi:hypothetical protein CFOL_v3_06174 [Cephalotus follicularis]|uniref:RVT_2 domain-containing protein n=1 Tax=Cephalotus follicularis TaxID=3775 RepID=A0A1Q3B3R0_CEPFO|nr:hypothetical protein CFOL_v3_06174 [Cephalotus follicularis]